MDKKESTEENLDFDLEEGEVPEFEISPSASHEELKDLGRTQSPNYMRSEGKSEFHKDRVKNNSLMRDCIFPKSTLRSGSVYFLHGNERNKSPLEVKLSAGEAKYNRSNLIPKVDLYDYNLTGRRSKYMHSFHNTYGSVENIMSKIGETLGESNNYCYKEFKSKDLERLISLNSSHKIDLPSRESGALPKRFKNSHHKRRRCTESSSHSDCDIVQTSSGIKIRSFSSKERRRKHSKKKKKFKHNQVELSDSEKKKSRFIERNEMHWDKMNARILNAKKCGGSENVAESQLLENDATEVLEITVLDRDKNALALPSGSLKEEEAEKPELDSFAVCNSEMNSINANSRDISEKFSVNDDDQDDDIELIKLRLLALTSNNKKRRIMASDKFTDAEHKISDTPKWDLSDNKIISSPESAVVCTDQHDNDIDEYELYLRAEALKTALLKKDQRRTKKSKNSPRSASILRDDSENNKEKFEKKTSNVAISKQKEAENGDAFSGVGIQSDDKSSIVEPSHEECDAKSEVKSDIDDKVDFKVDVRSPVSSKHMQSSLKCLKTDEYMSTYTTVNNVAINSPRDDQFIKKKLNRKRVKLKKCREFSVNELNIKENNAIGHNIGEENRKKMKAQLLDDVNVKRIKEHEKKSILVDSSQMINFQPTGDNKLLQSTRKGGDSVTEKCIEVTKIPETEQERIIVHLGSDSSDDDAPITKNQSHKSNGIPVDESKSTKLPEIVTCDIENKILQYGKSVELLLRDARRRIEKNVETARVPSTPEAVYNHLAPSQRLEYIRLKQKIAEKEKLRKMRDDTASSSADKISEGQPVDEKKVDFNVKLSSSKEEKARINEMRYRQTALGFRSKLFIREIKNCNKKILVNNSANVHAPNNKNNPVCHAMNTFVNNNRFRSGLKSQKGAHIKLQTVKRDAAAAALKNSVKSGSSAKCPSVEKDILERKKTLTQNRLYLERLKVIWKNIKIEKMIEEKCKNELKRLKVQQNFFELKMNQQRLKIKKLADESKQVYEAFQRMTKGMEVSSKKKKAATKDENGEKTSAEHKETGVEASEHISNVNTEHDSSNAIEIVKESDGSLDGKIATGKNKTEGEEEQAKNGEVLRLEVPSELKEYYSPLQILTNRSESKDCPRVDPNTIMCQYDLMGKCNDEECAYQHLRA